MNAFETNNASAFHVVPGPPPVSTTSQSDGPEGHLWLGEAAMAGGAEQSLRLLLVLDVQTGNALSWGLFARPAGIVDAARTFAKACVEAGAPKGSPTTVVSQLDHPRLELGTALRRASGVRASVVGCSGARAGMQSNAAEIMALVTAAVTFELAQANANDGPLSTVALEHLIDQVLYWYNRRHRSRQQGAIQ